MKTVRDTNDDWDREIEEDIEAGKLDALGQEAIAAYRTGETSQFPPAGEQ